MTVAISELQQRVQKRFPDVEQVDNSTLKFMRVENGRPYAVCYFELTDHLPAEAAELTALQDRLIGPDYFKGSKSLQWNHYLYFITPNGLAEGDVQRAKRFIENDRSYARKFVISENDVEAVLAPPPVAPPEVKLHANVFTVWAELLSEAGAYAAVSSDADLPARLKMIEKSSVASANRRPPTGAAVTGRLPHLKSLQLKQYRKYPVRKEYDFGTANLIVGPNAAGKTSLLEAIEWFYCGRNKRNLQHDKQYIIDAVMSDGRRESATATRKPEVFRKRNLDWYGQPEIKTNNLCLSFAQYNFLDTDAAVELSDSTAHIQEDLARLLVGPDAARVWSNIERVNEAVRQQVRLRSDVHRQRTSELAVIEKQLKAAIETKFESDVLRAQLGEMIDTLGWKFEFGDDPDEFADEVLRNTSDLISIAEQATELSWVVSPVSLQSLRTYWGDAQVLSKAATGQLEKLNAQQQRLSSLQQELGQTRSARKLIDDAMRFVESGVLDREAELRQCQVEIARLANLLGAASDKTLDAVSTIDPEERLSASFRAAVAQRTKGELALSDAETKYQQYSSLKEEVASLTQQMREFAAQIVQSAADPDQCPLCHTTFPKGELEKHIQAGAHTASDAAGTQLLRTIREHQRVVRDASRLVKACEELSEFRKATKLAPDSQVGVVSASIRQALGTLSLRRQRFAALRKEIAALEARGLSGRGYEDIVFRLRDMGHDLADPKVPTLEKLKITLERRISETSEKIEAEKAGISALESWLADRLKFRRPSAERFANAIALLQERAATTRSLFDEIRRRAASLKWEASAPLAEFVVKAEAVRNLATRLQAALNAEATAQNTRTECEKRKADLTAQIDRDAVALRRYTQAGAALQRVVTRHSLSQGMEAALAEIKSTVEKIFVRIHAPAEFSRLADNNFSTLVRSAGGAQAKLTEISTGQRAAFGLSIFLAQNGQASAAPPVMLIDDPIAHVDDLNSLSFLDYLREVAISGRRQLFFATANSKLATLFERKFDFLGEGFRRFDLARE